jgi:hypothetical protein
LQQILEGFAQHGRSIADEALPGASRGARLRPTAFHGMRFKYPDPMKDIHELEDTLPCGILPNVVIDWARVVRDE